MWALGPTWGVRGRKPPAKFFSVVVVRHLAFTMFDVSFVRSNFGPVMTEILFRGVCTQVGRQWGWIWFVEWCALGVGFVL